MVPPPAAKTVSSFACLIRHFAAASQVASGSGDVASPPLACDHDEERERKGCDLRILGKLFIAPSSPAKALSAQRFQRICVVAFAA